MRTAIPAALVVASALLLAGCSGGGSSPSSTPSSASTAGASGCTASGKSSEAVEVTGDAKTVPTVAVGDGFSATTPQRSVITAGSGAEAKKGDVLLVDFALYDSTGKALGVQGWDSGNPAYTVTIGSGQLLPIFDELFACGTVGSRAVLTASAQEGLGASVDPTQLGFESADSPLILVGDIEKELPTKADGAPQKAKAGFPKVSLDDTGKPTITFPAGAKKPSKTSVEVLKKGTGAKIKSGDSLAVQYQGVVWGSDTPFDQSWGRGVTTLTTDQTIKGFTKALVGQTVGSQVLAVIPPADGYGKSGSQDGTIKGTDTIVFVIDILAKTNE